MAGPFSFGRRSEAQFVTLHHDLQIVYTGAIEVFDFSIIQGARTIEQQILNVTNRVSKTLDSRHIPRDLEGHYDPNKPGSAGDTTPYTEGVNPYALDSDPRHVREKKKHRFYYMQGVFLHVAHREGIVIRQGVDWDMDGDFFDQKFDDLGHLELGLKLPKLIVPDDLLEQANEALLARGLKAYRNP